MAKRYRVANVGFLFVAALFLGLVAQAQPKADFSLSALSGCSPLSETFTNKTTGGSTPYTYLWKLGNSNTSVNKDASAIYYICGRDVERILVPCTGHARWRALNSAAVVRRSCGEWPRAHQRK